MTQSNQTQKLQEIKQRPTKRNHKTITKKLRGNKSTQHPNKPNIPQPNITKNNNIQSVIQNKLQHIPERRLESGEITHKNKKIKSDIIKRHKKQSKQTQHRHHQIKKVSIKRK